MWLRSKSEDGAALVMVVIMLAVVSLIIVGVATLMMSNLTQSTAQVKSLEAYYMAKSGADLCFAALVQDDDALLNSILSDSSFIGPYTDFTEILFDSDLDDGADNLGGTVEVRILLKDEGGTRWVKIESTATPTDETLSRTVEILFDSSNPYSATER